jgi:hypothetical protein
MPLDPNKPAVVLLHPLLTETGSCLRLQVEDRKSTVGTGATMSGMSLGLFNITNKARLRAFKILYSQVAPSHSQSPGMIR